MKCPYRPCGLMMTVLGCRVSSEPFYWCPSCGTISTCDGVVATPAVILQLHVETAREPRPDAEPAQPRSDQ